MEVEISLDPKQKKPKIIIVADAITEEVRAISDLLRSDFPGIINGYDPEGIIVRIRYPDILRIYTEQQRVFCETADGCYQLHERLYVLEEMLGDPFVRISNSEIVNIRHVIRLDARLSGTICVYLEKNIMTYASRRYVRKIKEKLGI
ncbi:MAG: LytTR family transcriptional regulator [Christensenellaceae bacterium]|nr:LytTR family transcriptional regulator [Christensenellaceae bacterium]